MNSEISNMGGNGDKQHQAKKATGKGAAKGVQLKPRRRTYGGLGLMKRSTNENDGFGAVGEHKFAGKRRHSSPVTKPMRLSRRLSYAIAKSTPLKSPTITAYALKWTPNTLYGDLKEQAGSVKEVLKTPEAKKK